MNELAREMHSLSDVLDAESKKSLIRSLVTLVMFFLSGVVPTTITVPHHLHALEDRQVIELEVRDNEVAPSIDIVSSGKPIPKAVTKPLLMPVTPSSHVPPSVVKSDETPAKVIEQVLPSIPDSLRRNEFRTYVRVTVLIGKDGSTKVSLREPSGDAEVDRIVIGALSQWRWKPAEKSGVAIDSVRNFKFEFEVR